MDLTLVIPALNEAGNIGELVRRARGELDELAIAWEILVVDGGSTDSTRQEAEAAGAHIIHQPECSQGAGYGGALKSGFAQARGEVIVTMDSDLSHEPEFIKSLWQARDRADIIIASRYVVGGRADMPLFRRALSKLLNIVYTTILSIPVKDISSGFRLYRLAALRSIHIEACDFDVLEEILIKLYVGGHGVAEVPFHYRPRREGKSHAKLVKFAFAYLKTLFRMMRLRKERE